MLVSCHMPKKIKIGRSDFFFFAKRDFVDKIGGKSGLQKKPFVKNQSRGDNKGPICNFCKRRNPNDPVHYRNVCPSWKKKLLQKNQRLINQLTGGADSSDEEINQGDGTARDYMSNPLH